MTMSNTCLHCLDVKRIVARNLCKNCYEDKDIRYHYPTKDGRVMDGTLKCSVKDCSEPHKANTYCINHNHKFDKFGDPLGEAEHETKRKERLARQKQLSLDGLRECFDCKEALPFDSFTSNKGNYDGYGFSTYCKSCQKKRNDEYKKKFPWIIQYKRWARRIEEQYGITPDDYYRMWSEQDGCCKICKGWFRGKTNGGSECVTFCVDHCHNTGKVRGLLCRDCNTGLGHFKDNTKRLEDAIDYLKEAADDE